jgi:hypothetical protein
MTMGSVDLKATHRVTLCGSGGSSDCPAFRVLDDGRIGISSSHDGGTPLTELVFEGHEITQMLRAFGEGTVPQDITDAIAADDARQPA